MNKEKESKLSLVKDYIGIVQSVATIAAIIAGGIWFLSQKESIPKIVLSHQVAHYKLSKDKTWIQLKANFENVGKTPFEVNLAKVRIQQVSPVPDIFANKLTADNIFRNNGRVYWPLMQDEYLSSNRFILYSHEKDSLEYDFVVPTNIEVVRLYTSYRTKYDTYSTVISQSTVYNLGNK